MANQVLPFLSQTLPTLISDIEIRSRFSPPVMISTQELLAGTKPTGALSPYVKLAQPTVILSGSVGRQVIAPAGVVGAEDWKKNLALAGMSLVVVGALIYRAGYFVGKRSRR